ncbi:VOC family protein [Streptomyces sp. JL2001]|uniref:VOC family protein n=1 Tax=Streptomyces sp. JL2001 TaxID=3342488 RepID=UPI003D805D35
MSTVRFDVGDLDAMRARLRAEGWTWRRQCRTSPVFTRFGRTTDPEGDRTEVRQAARRVSRRR